MPLACGGSSPGILLVTAPLSNHDKIFALGLILLWENVL
jgi:hypothetical protein